jgi:hypothetical protein
MIAGRLRPRTAVNGGAEQRDRKRSRLGRYVVLIFGAGVVSGTAALAGIPPFGSLQALLAPISELLHPQPPPIPIQASTIFPPVPPVHKVIDVYDPPPPAPRATSAPQPPAASPKPKASPSPRQRPSPSPPLHSTPSPSPGND